MWWSLFLTKLPEDLQLYQEETPTQVLSCEYCKFLRIALYQFDKTDIQYWAFAGLLFLIKNMSYGFY